MKKYIFLSLIFLKLFFISSSFSMDEDLDNPENTQNPEILEKILDHAANCLNIWEGDETNKGSIWKACIYYRQNMTTEGIIKIRLDCLLNSHDYLIEVVLKNAHALSRAFEFSVQSDNRFKAMKFLKKIIEQLNSKVVETDFLALVDFVDNTKSNDYILSRLNKNFMTYYCVMRIIDPCSPDVIKSQAFLDLIEFLRASIINIKYPDENARVKEFFKKLAWIKYN